MALDLINLGTTANDRTGDDWRSGGNKINAAIAQLNATTGQSVVPINEESDFPEQDSSSITLESGKAYIVSNPFSTGKYFVCEGGSLLGLIGDIASITYSGSSPMFQVTNNRFFLDKMIVNCANATVFSLTGDGTGNLQHRINVSNFEVLNCVEVMTASSWPIIAFQTVGFDNVTGSGSAFSFTGSAGIIWSFNEVALFNMVAGAKGYDFGVATTLEVELGNCIVTGDPSVIPISGATGSGNIISGQKAAVTQCNFAGFTQVLENISVNDIRWDFFENAGLSNSRNAGDLYLDNEVSGTETITVSNAGDWYELGIPAVGSNVFASDVLDRFEMSANGRLTHIGEDDIDAEILGRATIEKAGGGSNLLEVRIAINWDGTVNDGGVFKTRGLTQNTTPTTVPFGGLIPLSQGDDVVVIYRNTNGSSNILVDAVSFEVVA